MATIFANAAFVSAPGIVIYYRAFFDCIFLQNLSWPKWPVRGNGVQPLPSNSAFYPLPMCVQNNKAIWVYGHL